MKKLIKRIFRGKYYKNGESYVDTIVKVIICVVVGALLLTSVYAVAKSGLESAKNKVNDLLDYNSDGEDGPGGGDTSIPDGEDGPGGGDTSIPDGEDGPGGGDTSIPDGEDGPGGGDTSTPGGGDESEPEVPDLPQLAAPLIDIEGDTLSIIDEEGDADKFELYIDGEYTQDINAEPTTVFDLSILSLEDGSHTIQCKAKAEGYQTSEFSNSVEYEVAAFAPYLTFRSVNPFTIRVASPKWDGTMEYSTDTENWTTWNGSSISSISSVDGKVYLRGTGNTRVSANSTGQYSQFLITGTAVECVGNIETLLDWQAVVDGQHPEMGYYCFAYAFLNNSALITAPELPATTLAYHCYAYMFKGCTRLTTAPDLPSTTLAEGCYSGMFYGCTRLTTAPDLPSTTLAKGCYHSMFNGCTALTTAPALPATTLTDYCYEYMFYGCTALTTAPALPATTLANNCYRSMFYGCTALTTAPALPATTLASYCYYEMFRDCTNLTTAPALPATTLADRCYQSMFFGCTALTTAPELPATTLANDCYNHMFYGCTNLTTAPALPATTLANECYYRMFYGCTSLTTAPDLPSTTLADYCYYSMFNGCTALTTAPALPATTLAERCYGFMFYGCTNLTTAPALPATTLAERCYQSMFSGCTSLTTAPELPATALAEGCYEFMFSGCTALTTAPALPATTLASNCYESMFQGCTNLKVSATQTGTYQYQWWIPTSGNASDVSNWNKDMFKNTGGTFTGDPAINTIYYLEYPPVGSEPAIPPVLEAPTNISVSGSTLIWDAVANAMSYNVYKDGILFNTVDANSCDISGITEVGSHSFTVQALADGYTPSAISDVIVYEVVSEGLTGTKWQFNDDMELDEEGLFFRINAIVSNAQHTLTIDRITLPDYWDLHLYKSGERAEFYYSSWWTWYSGSGSWVSTPAPTIEILDGEDVNNPEFIAWLQENATKIS